MFNTTLCFVLALKKSLEHLTMCIQNYCVKRRGFGNETLEGYLITILKGPSHSSRKHSQHPAQVVYTKCFTVLESQSQIRLVYDTRV